MALLKAQALAVQPLHSHQTTTFGHRIVTSATSTDPGYAAANDVFQVCKLPAGYVVLDSYTGHDATLGAGCTVQLGYADTDGANFVALTAASTAGAASHVRQNVVAHDPLAGEKILALKIAGANVGAAAEIKSVVTVAHAKTHGL